MWLVSTGFRTDGTERPRPAYRVHVRHKREVCARVVLGREEETVALSCADVDHLGVGRLDVDAVDLDDAHGVVLEPQVLAGEGADVDGAEEIGPARRRARAGSGCR